MYILHVQKRIQLLFFCAMINIKEELFHYRLKREGEYILN